MAERKCLMTFYPTDCKDNCFNCECGGAEATKDMYVSIHDVQRICAITGGAADTDDGEHIAEIIRNNLENMVIPAADVQPVDRWISVKDKLPNEGERVLIYAPKTQNQYYVAMFYTLRDEIKFTMNIYGTSYCWYANDVTHWQPLSESPRDEYGGARMDLGEENK